MGNGGIGKIVAIDDMNGTNRVEVAEIPGYADSAVETGDEPPEANGKLDYPSTINVDYDNGVIYIFRCRELGEHRPDLA